MSGSGSGASVLSVADPAIPRKEMSRHAVAFAAAPLPGSAGTAEPKPRESLT